MFILYWKHTNSGLKQSPPKATSLYLMQLKYLITAEFK